MSASGEWCQPNGGEGAHTEGSLLRPRHRHGQHVPAGGAAEAEAARHHLHLLPHLGLGLVGDHVPAHLAIALGSGEEGGLARQRLAQVQGEEGLLAIRLGVGEVVVTTHIWGSLGRRSVSCQTVLLNLLTAAVPWNPF